MTMSTPGGHDRTQGRIQEGAGGGEARELMTMSTPGGRYRTQGGYRRGPGVGRRGNS